MMPYVPAATKMIDEVINGVTNMKNVDDLENISEISNHLFIRLTFHLHVHVYLIFHPILILNTKDKLYLK